MSKEEAYKTHAYIYPFGSFKLGVQFDETDIDVICVVPNFINEGQFFNLFKKELENNPSVGYVLDVIDTKIPILKIQYDGVHIDLLYASMDPKHLTDGS